MLSKDSSKQNLETESMAGGRLMGASKTVIGGFGAWASTSLTLSPGSVQENMKLLSDKLMERFKKLALAFRYFDLKSTGRLSLADFNYGIDQIGGLKFTRQQISELF